VTDSLGVTLKGTLRLKQLWLKMNIYV